MNEKRVTKDIQYFFRSDNVIILKQQDDVITTDIDDLEEIFHAWKIIKEDENAIHKKR